MENLTALTCVSQVACKLEASSQRYSDEEASDRSNCASCLTCGRVACAGTSPSGRQPAIQTTWTLSCGWSCWAAKKMMAAQVHTSMPQHLCVPVHCKWRG